jgi:DNA polymerase-3 subunit delta'
VTPMARGTPASETSTRSGEGGWPDWADSAPMGWLREPIRQLSVGHAYLLAGPAGVGKRAIARAFAQAICCERPDPTDPSLPCGGCRSCRNVLRGAHPDVEWFDLEAQAQLADKPARGASLTIETIRTLRASCALLPVEAGRRILIVDDAETMLEPAQEALLKTLEEPPRFVTIVLLTDEPDALAATVRSRCHQIAVQPATESTVRQTLLERGVKPELAAEVATLSRGRSAWALAAVQDDKLLQARRDEREAARSWIASSGYDRLVTAFKLGDQFGKRRRDISGIVQAAVQLLREQMIAATGLAAESGATDASESQSGQAALRWGRAVAASLRCLADLEANVRPRLALEAMVIQWPDLERD